MSWDGWIGVDLDGTIAHYEHGQGIAFIGPPLQPMVDRVKAWLAEGTEVRIFTARVATSGRTNEEGTIDGEAFAEEQRALIETWCLEHLGQVLPITATKDFQMELLYDDRCRQVEKNTGLLLVEEV